MSTTIVKANFPEAPGSVGVSGKEQVLFVNYGSGASAANPVWTKVGGVTDNSFAISMEVQTVQTKDSDYWAEGGITSKSGEVSAEIIAKRDDAGQLAIEHFVMNDATTREKKALQFALVELDTAKYTKFWAAPTSWETTGASEDLLKKSLSATLLGAPEELTGFNVPGRTGVLPPITFSKAAAADVVLNVASGTITGLKNGTSSVTSSNYSIALGGQSIVIDSSYLSGLPNGDVTLNVLLADSSQVSCVATITS